MDLVPNIKLNSEHNIQGTDESGQHEFLEGNKHQSTQIGVIEGNRFVKNGQDHIDSQHIHCTLLFFYLPLASTGAVV